MPNALQTAGSQGSKQTKYAPIYTNRFFTGEVTNRNPLRDGGSAYLIEKFYSGARYDSLIGGLNVEITPRLTIQRRFGTSSYNGNTIPPIFGFYSFSPFIAGAQVVFVIADTAATVRDTTFNTNAILFTKSNNSGQTNFQSVGNFLYMGNGVDQKKLTKPATLWTANTAFTVGQYILDTNGNIQKVTTAGTTSGSQPAWSVTDFTTTADNTVTWTKYGNQVSNWGVITPTSAPTSTPGNTVSAALKYWGPGVTFPAHYVILDSNGNLQIISGAGTTGGTIPLWATSFLATTIDAGAAWQNAGAPAAWAAVHAYTTNTYPFIVLDSNGNLQLVSTAGTSGATQPTWNAVVGGNTVDGTVTWLNIGPGAIKVFKGWIYGYSNHTVTGHVGTMGPTYSTGPIIGTPTTAFSLIGNACTDPQCDLIRIFRTADGGAIQIFDQDVTNPGSGTWSISDSVTDGNLNQLITAPIAHANDQPPAGAIALSYHVGRVFVSVGNQTFYSQATVSTGISAEAFPPLNVVTWPSLVVRHTPTPTGLLVHTVNGIYVIAGQGTSVSPLFPSPYLDGIGLANYNALTTNGSIIYQYTPQQELISLDPNSGITDIGFPVADQLTANFPASSSYLTWAPISSTDKALYISDGSGSFKRWSPTSAPETGSVWSPTGKIAAGFRAVQCIQTDATTWNLLYGPGRTNAGPILKRDPTVFTDVAGTTYAANFTIGNITLAHHGQMAELGFIGTDCTALGTRPTLGVLLDEIKTQTGVAFETLIRTIQDPPLLPASATVFGDRYYFTQTREPAWCRHLQIQVTWPIEAAHNEMLTYSIFGAHYQEK